MRVIALLLLLLTACGTDATSPGTCAFPLPERPRVQRPVFAEGEYVIEAARWGIRTDGTEAEATTDGINEAIRWAAAEGYQRVRLPGGHYLIGKRLYDHYTGGIELVDDMALMMDDDTVLQIVPNETWAYCGIAIDGLRNVGVYGGTILGDRDHHD